MIRIWPADAPGSEDLDLEEEIVERSEYPEIIKDRAIMKIKVPGITAYVPENPNGTGIIIAPGGYYQRIVLDKEGLDLVPWLNSEGITVFIMKYRMPSDRHINRELVALQDAQRALRYIRTYADRWRLNPYRIGIMGFSAGGHLAACLSTMYDADVYEKIDAIDKVSARPDFQILGYPLITLEKPFAPPEVEALLETKGKSRDLLKMFSPNRNTTAETPPAFIMHAEDDEVVLAEHSRLYYSALKKENVPAELHIFKDGGHGYALRNTAGKAAKNWPELLMRWMKINKIIK